MVPRLLGSRASCSPAPARLNARTAMVMNSPGKKTSHQNGSRFEAASPSMLPQVGVGGAIPSPMNPRAASISMAMPMLVVKSTLEETGRTSFLMKQVVSRDDQICATLMVKLVCVDLQSGKATRIPDKLMTILNT